MNPVTNFHTPKSRQCGQFDPFVPRDLTQKLDFNNVCKLLIEIYTIDSVTSPFCGHFYIIKKVKFWAKKLFSRVKMAKNEELEAFLQRFVSRIGFWERISINTLLHQYTAQKVNFILFIVSV